METDGLIYRIEFLVHPLFCAESDVKLSAFPASSVE